MAQVFRRAGYGRPNLSWLRLARGSLLSQLRLAVDALSKRRPATQGVHPNGEGRTRAAAHAQANAAPRRAQLGGIKIFAVVWRNRAEIHHSMGEVTVCGASVRSMIAQSHDTEGGGASPTRRSSETTATISIIPTRIWPRLRSQKNGRRSFGSSQNLIIFCHSWSPRTSHYCSSGFRSICLIALRWLCFWLRA